MNPTPEQAEAIAHESGPILVIAGAGTGKTKVITERIVTLITEKGVKPDTITALTFTEKAAGEMQERLDLTLPLGENGVWVSTFHGYAADVISKYPYHLGHDPASRIATPTEVVSILREHFEKFTLSKLLPPDNPVRFLTDFVSYYETCIESLVPHQDRVTACTNALTNSSDDAERERFERELELLANIPVAQQILREARVSTYAELMALTVTLFRTSAQALRNEQARCRYLLVDEYQDTNPAQAEIVKCLAGKRGNIMVVGDDDQSIYGFRGASLDNILTFTDEFPDTKTVTLTDNFRSVQPILDASYQLIQRNNPFRLESKLAISKRLKSHSEIDGSVSVREFANTAAEADWIAEEIATHISNGVAANKIAILARSHGALAACESALLARGIPRRRSKQQSFYSQSAVAQSLGFLQFLVDQNDSHNLFYLLTQPPFGSMASITPLSLQNPNTLARRMNRSLWQSLGAEEPNRKAITWLEGACNQLDHTKPAEALIYFVKQSGWEAALIAEDQIQDLQSLNALYQEIRAFEKRHTRATIGQYLDHVTALIEAGEEAQVTELEDISEPAVALLTVHASKGLEFAHVYIIGLTEQSFPPYPKPDRLLGGSGTQEEKDEHYREERRLLYVAMTRAQESLTLSYALRKPGSKQAKKPSRFIAETGCNVTIMQTLPRVIGNTPEPAPAPVLVFPKSISISALETFEHSPEEYRNQYVYQLINQEASNASFGTTVHEVLRTAVAAEMSGETIDLESLYNSLWIPYGYESETTQLRWKAEGLAAITRYLAENTETTTLLEHPVRLQLGDVVITGKVDRVTTINTGGVRVIDYKTKRESGTVSKQALTKNLPLPFYALALTNSGMDVRSLELHFVMLGQTLAQPVTPALLDATEEKLRSLVAALQQCYQTGVFSSDDCSVSVQ